MSDLSETSSSSGDWERIDDCSQELVARMGKMEEEMEKMKLEIEKKDKEIALLLSKMNENMNEELLRLKEEMRKIKEEGTKRKGKEVQECQEREIQITNQSKEMKTPQQDSEQRKWLSGNENEIISALGICNDQSASLQTALYECYYFYKHRQSGEVSRHLEALLLVLGIMEGHMENSAIQESCAACLYYLLQLSKKEMKYETNKQVINTLLSCIERHTNENIVIYNCLQSLFQFKLAEESTFALSHLVVLLLDVLQQEDSSNWRAAISFLRSLNSHLDNSQKSHVGSLGAIKVILDLIKKGCSTNLCDDVMKGCWGFLWSITDEVPTNSARFLAAGGLALFHKCYSTTDANERSVKIVRNMTGLMGNIAEVDELRSQLTNDETVKIFMDLLEFKESIAMNTCTFVADTIRYNSAGVLANMVSDGDVVWQNMTLKRDDVMQSIVKATSSWKPDADSLVSYKSLRPILRLLPLWHSYASQNWAVFALANLTTTDGTKSVIQGYCAMIREEGGLPLLRQLASDPRTTEETRKLANIVLQNVERTKPQVASEECDETKKIEELETYVADFNA